MVLYFLLGITAITWGIWRAHMENDNRIYKREITIYDCGMDNRHGAYVTIQTYVTVHLPVLQNFFPRFITYSKIYNPELYDYIRQNGATKFIGRFVTESCSILSRNRYLDFLEYDDTAELDTATHFTVPDWQLPQKYTGCLPDWSN